MKKFLTIACLILVALSSQAQKKTKDLQYYYYYVNEDPTFITHLKAKKAFDEKKLDFRLPSSETAVKEMEADRDKILRSEKSYAEFLNRHGMKNSGEYASLWFNQLNTLKAFLRKNPEFANLTATERKNIIDKWFYSDF